MALEYVPMTASDRVAAGPGYYVPEATEKAGFKEAAKAAFVEENTIAQWAADLEYQSTAEAVDGYDQYLDVPEDLEDMPLTAWRDVSSPQMMQGRIAEVRAERERRRIMATNGWGSFVGAMGGYLISPETIPELLLTQGRSGVSGAVRLGLGALAFESAHEIAMHEQSYTRSWQESMTNVGLSAFAGAGLGYLVGSQAKRQFLKDLTREMQEIASPTALKPIESGSTAGAAAVAQAGEDIVHKPWLKWKRLGPIRSIAHSTAQTAQGLMNRVMEHSYMPSKALRGVAREVSLETRVNREIATMTQAVHRTLNKGYKTWAQEQQVGTLGRARPKNWLQFQSEVHLALVSGDTSASKAVETTAKALRTHYDNVYRTAKSAHEINPNASELTLEEMVTKYADSYAPRRYNRARIKKDERAFKDALQQAFKEERELIAFEDARKAADDPDSINLDDFRINENDAEIMAEIRSDVNASYDRIVNSFDLDVFMPMAHTSSGNPFKERKIPLKDKDMIGRGWLESDIQAMTMNYVNRVLKPSRMVLEQGDTEMKASLNNVVDEYRVLRDKALKAGDEKKAKQLEREQMAVVDSFETWRDRWYGRTTISKTRGEEAINDIMRTIRNLNVARMMGMVTLISVGDAARMNLSTIFAPELGKRAPGLIKAIKTARLSKGEWQKIGIAHETAMLVRSGRIMDDSGIFEGSSRAVQWSQKASRGLMRATGLAHWTDWMKETAAAYTQNDLMQKMRGFSRLNAKSRALLAELGVDENMAKAMQAEVAASKARPDAAKSVIPLGNDTLGYEGIGYVLRFENFENRELAERMANILFRESERNIVTPTAGDFPRIFRNDEVNKLMFQFQSFLFAAGTSITPVIGRRLRMGDPKAALILTNMLLGGMAAVAMRNMAYGETKIEEMSEWSGTDWALNAFDYSTVGPLFMMGFNYVNLLTGNGLVNALGAESMVRYQHHPIGSVAGPWYGTVNDSALALQSVFGVPFGQDMTPTDVRRIRRLLPWNNLAYISGGVTAAQQVAEEAVQ